MLRLWVMALALAVALAVVGCDGALEPMAPQAEPQKSEDPRLAGDPDDVIEQVLVAGRPILIPEDLEWLTDETPVTVIWAPRGDEQARIEQVTWGKIKGEYAGGG